MTRPAELTARLRGLHAATAFSVCLLAAPAALAQAMPPPDGPGHDGPGHGSPGHDYPGRDRSGHDSPGHDSPGHGSPGHDGPEHGGPGRDGPPFARMHEPDGEPGPFGTPPFLRGLALSDVQNERVFTILHGQAPRRRALDIAGRKADEALRTVAGSAGFDAAAAAAAAQALGQAVADQELLRLQTRALLKAVLTPEQRAELDAPRGMGRKAGQQRQHVHQGENRK